MSNTELTLDISTLWRIFKKHAVIIIVITVVATITGYILASFIVPKKYSANAKFYVENRGQTQTETLNQAEISAARSIISTCINLFTTRDIARLLIEETGLDYSVGQILGMISMNALGNTETMEITITMDEPQKAIDTLNVLTVLCMDRFTEFISAGKIVIADSPAGGGVVFPSVNMFTAAGFLIGFLGTFLVVFVIEILDTKVKAEDDLFKIYNIPVFAEIMNFDVRVKGDYGYEYK